jgi:predicted metal-dependent hydrolase
MERSLVQYGTTAIPYAIQRSNRRKTVSIAIDPDRGVIVTAPTAAPIAKLDDVVHRKAAWVVERLRRHSSSPPPPPEKEFVSGASFLYLGRQYRLKVQPGAVERPDVRLLRGWLTVTLPDGRDGPSSVGKALVEWYRKHAGERVPERASQWAGKVGVAVPQVLVRDQRKRWASCDKAGVLRVNWRIIQAPMRLVDYVVAHELVHLVHPDHTPEFWARLGRAMPDYEGRRERLRQVGRGYEW